MVWRTGMMSFKVQQWRKVQISFPLEFSREWRFHLVTHHSNGSRLDDHMTPHVTWQFRAKGGLPGKSNLTVPQRSHSKSWSKVLHQHISEPASLSNVTSGENKNGSLVIKDVCAAVGLVWVQNSHPVSQALWPPSLIGSIFFFQGIMLQKQ